MDNKLIIECGSYIGDETEYFLKNGFNVLAIDANKEMCDKLNERFKEYIDDRLKIHNLAITTENENVLFYISKKREWSSLNINIAERKEKSEKSVIVKGVKFSEIIKEINDDIFLIKIDIEGNDIVVLEELKNIDYNKLPNFISCETECVGKNEDYSKKMYDTLNALKELNYKKFKLINQKLNTMVDYNNYIDMTIKNYNEKNIKINEYNFFNIIDDGVWMDYNEAKELLKEYRENWFIHNKKIFSFWNDWVAMK